MLNNTYRIIEHCIDPVARAGSRSLLDKSHNSESSQPHGCHKEQYSGRATEAAHIASNLPCQWRRCLSCDVQWGRSAQEGRPPRVPNEPSRNLMEATCQYASTSSNDTCSERSVEVRGARYN